MAHQIAKLLLEHADTFLERKKAIQSALELGMPLNEIEEYLDWLELANSCKDADSPKNSINEDVIPPKKGTQQSNEKGKNDGH